MGELFGRRPIGKGETVDKCVSRDVHQYLPILHWRDVDFGRRSRRADRIHRNNMGEFHRISMGFVWSVSAILAAVNEDDRAALQWCAVLAYRNWIWNRPRKITPQTIRTTEKPSGHSISNGIPPCNMVEKTNFRKTNFPYSKKHSFFAKIFHPLVINLTVIKKDCIMRRNRRGFLNPSRQYWDE